MNDSKRVLCRNVNSIAFRMEDVWYVDSPQQFPTATLMDSRRLETVAGWYDPSGWERRLRQLFEDESSVRVLVGDG
jgi:hypothetical protein